MIGYYLRWHSQVVRQRPAKPPFLSSNLSATFMLFIIATPIGNLEDITYRAVKTLTLCDYVLCEDTRQSKILFNHYQIHTPCQSYHRFNEEKKLNKIIADLKSGKTIGLVSDRGTPTIADPGFRLLQRVIKENIPYTALPGPSSFVNALVLAGGFPENFTSVQFLGFFSKKKSELELQIKTMAFYPGLSVAFLPPSIAKEVFSLFAELFPSKNLTLVREMTKIHENTQTLKAQGFLSLSKEFFLGEMVLVTQGFEPINETLSLVEMVHFLERFFCMSEKEALETSAKIKNVRKQEYYRSKNQ